jgi:dihydroorotase
MLVRLAALAMLAALAPAQQYDLVLKNGHVIDPANNVNAAMDVAVAEGKIAAVEKSIPAGRARKVVDVSGLYVTPGFIDIHAHASINKWPTRVSYPADMNLASGLTTIVDAGTWGAENFHLMKENLIDHSTIRVLAWLNICNIGIEPGYETEQHVERLDAQACAATIEQHRDVIVGIKTAHYWTSKPFDAEHPPWVSVERAVEAGKRTNVPVMVDFWPRPPERPYADLILDKLRPGDIHTHVFAQQFPILGDDGKVNPILFQARRRGVIFDLGHGAGSFWFRNAVPAIRQGFIPDSISTDLHMDNVNGPVVDMITTM